MRLNIVNFQYTIKSYILISIKVDSIKLCGLKVCLHKKKNEGARIRQVDVYMYVCTYI